jgi:hypothetical protein
MAALGSALRECSTGISCALFQEQRKKKKKKKKRGNSESFLLFPFSFFSFFFLFLRDKVLALGQKDKLGNTGNTGRVNGGSRSGGGGFLALT